MTVEYHPLTVSDLNNAVTYYNQQRADLGDEFRSEVFAAIERVRLNPLRFAVVEHEIRPLSCASVPLFCPISARE
jgi:hypothetical protein